MKLQLLKRVFVCRTNYDVLWQNILKLALEWAKSGGANILIHTKVLGE